MLEDPFLEFLVGENRSFRKENVELDLNDRYWDERFTFREEMVPVFLAKFKYKVLQAGKYLNVIRECGRLDVKNPYEDTTGVMGFTQKALMTDSCATNPPTGSAEDAEMTEEIGAAE